MDGICCLLFFRFMNRFPLLGKAIAEGGQTPHPKAASPDVRTLWARVQYEFSYFPTNFWRTGEDENRYPIRMMVSARIWVPAAASSQRMDSSGQ